jgi:hypothetical protein
VSGLIAICAVSIAALGGIGCAQRWAERRRGHPASPLLRPPLEDPFVRRTMRTAIPIAWITILVGSPLAFGRSPLTYYSRAFAPPAGSAALMAFPAVALAGFAVNLAVGWLLGAVRVEPQHPPQRLRGKLWRRLLLTPAFGAPLEELVFRGLLLEQLLGALPATAGGAALAVTLSAAIFSSVHFLEAKPPQTPFVQAWLGLFGVGGLLGAAYAACGRQLWLPIAIHGAGMIGVEVPRLVTRMEGRRWLIGTSEFPHAGAIGLAASALGCLWLASLARGF